jgi:hypothetical protein
MGKAPGRGTRVLSGHWHNRELLRRIIFRKYGSAEVIIHLWSASRSSLGNEEGLREEEEEGQYSVSWEWATRWKARDLRVLEELLAKVEERGKWEDARRDLRRTHTHEKFDHHSHSKEGYQSPQQRRQRDPPTASSAESLDEDVLEWMVEPMSSRRRADKVIRYSSLPSSSSSSSSTSLPNLFLGHRVENWIIEGSLKLWDISFCCSTTCPTRSKTSCGGDAKRSRLECQGEMRPATTERSWRSTRIDFLALLSDLRDREMSREQDKREGTSSRAQMEQRLQRPQRELMSSQELLEEGSKQQSQLHGLLLLRSSEAVTVYSSSELSSSRVRILANEDRNLLDSWV